MKPYRNTENMVADINSNTFPAPLTGSIKHYFSISGLYFSAQKAHKSPVPSNYLQEYQPGRNLFPCNAPVMFDAPQVSTPARQSPLKFEILRLSRFASYHDQKLFLFLLASRGNTCRFESNQRKTTQSSHMQLICCECNTILTPAREITGLNRTDSLPITDFQSPFMMTCAFFNNTRLLHSNQCSFNSTVDYNIQSLFQGDLLD